MVLATAQLAAASAVVRAGGIIGYPTEAVFGFGCDPADRDAVLRLCKIKHRPWQAGLILLAATVEQLAGWIQPDPGELIQLRAALNHPVTWVVSRGPMAGDWVTGGRARVAVRISQHALASELCLAVDGPIVSTSANRRGRRPAVTALQTRRWFGPELDYVLNGATGGRSKPSEIRDARSGECLRSV